MGGHGAIIELVSALVKGAKICFCQKQVLGTLLIAALQNCARCE